LLIHLEVDVDVMLLVPIQREGPARRIAALNRA